MEPLQDPSTLPAAGGQTDFTIWLIMFGALILVALVLAYMSKDMER